MLKQLTGCCNNLEGKWLHCLLPLLVTPMHYCACLVTVTGDLPPLYQSMPFIDRFNFDDNEYLDGEWSAPVVIRQPMLHACSCHGYTRHCCCKPLHEGAGIGLAGFRKGHAAAQSAGHDWFRLPLIVPRVFWHVVVRVFCDIYCVVLRHGHRCRLRPPR